MSTHVAKSISDYFDASNARSAEGVAACFTPNAVVIDEGQERKGTAEILEWKAWAEKKYQPIYDVLGSTETDGRTIVTCKVSGSFPGSPVDLRFAFTLEDGKIARLQVVS
jgi:ketosteroid isomerase-like protein